MSRRFAEIAFTPAVAALQERNGSRRTSPQSSNDGTADPLTAAEAAFLERTDGFFVATVSETGWPYVQHRGGPRGFVKVLSDSQFAFADFGGNRQYVSAGNASRDERVAIIVVDHAARRRLKLLGRIRFVDIQDADPELARRVQLPGYRARIERVALVDVVAFDWNCPQHITPRFTIEEIETARDAAQSAA